VQYNFEEAGFKVEAAMDGMEGLEKARSSPPDLILLDVMLPKLDGLEVCKLLRADPKTAGVPIIMLTAKAAEIDRVLGLELGADDYVTKPFSPRELLLRVKKRLKQETGPEAPASTPDVIQIGALTVDAARHMVKVKQRRVELTAIEFKLLLALMQRAGYVQSREQLLRDVWEYDTHIDTRTVDTHIRRLREKLAGASRHLDTVRGVGYRFLDIAP
jgi:two-component system phosphate regulon response regulator PhoB